MAKRKRARQQQLTLPQIALMLVIIIGAVVGGFVFANHAWQDTMERAKDFEITITK